MFQIIADIVISFISAITVLVVYKLNEKFRQGQTESSVEGNKKRLKILRKDVDNIEDDVVDSKVCNIKHKYLNGELKKINSILDEMSKDIKDNNNKVIELEKKVDIILEHNGYSKD